MKALRHIGYWADPDEPDDLPRVADQPTGPPDPAVLAYLRGGTEFVAAAGYSQCRVCGADNGSVELTDGVRFIWPEGLAHYVEAHDLVLPAEVTAAMREPVPEVDLDAFVEDFFAQRIAVDTDWWATVTN